jgi:hypothetical protein
MSVGYLKVAADPTPSAKFALEPASVVTPACGGGVGVPEGEGVRVSVRDGERVREPLGEVVEVRVALDVAVAVSVLVTDEETVGVLLGESLPEVVGVLDGELVAAAVCGALVVIDGVADSVREGVPESVPLGVPDGDGVAVLEGVPESVPLGVAVDCDECDGVLDGDGVAVLEGVPVGVPEIVPDAESDGVPDVVAPGVPVDEVEDWPAGASCIPLGVDDGVALPLGASAKSSTGLNFRTASTGSKVSAVQFCSATETGTNATRREPWDCVSVAFAHRAVKRSSVAFRQELAADAAVQERYSSTSVATVSSRRREDSEEQLAAAAAAPAPVCRRRLELPST